MLKKLGKVALNDVMLECVLLYYVIKVASLTLKMEHVIGLEGSHAVSSFCNHENSCSKRALEVTRQDKINACNQKVAYLRTKWPLAINVARRVTRRNLCIMVRLATCLLLASVAALAAAQSSVLPRLINTFPVKHPAFVQLFATEKTDVDPLDKFTLYVSNFDALAIFQVKFFCSFLQFYEALKNKYFLGYV